jgi:hypothetical protein
MHGFPPLDCWFDITRVTINPNLDRFDLVLKSDISQTDYENLIDQLCLVIARLRLGKDYPQWLAYWNNIIPIPPDLKRRYQNVFWKGFVSTTATKRGGVPVFDSTALQGYIGELFLYIIQTQLNRLRISSCPEKPKPYSKSEGIDSLEITGDVDDPASLHYTVWECKATTDATYLSNYESKIYSQHLYETPKSFADMVDSLDHRLKDHPILGPFIDGMIDDFYQNPPTLKKRFGGCVLLSPNSIIHLNAFSGFRDKFIGILADAPECRQARLCYVSDLDDVVEKVRIGIWKKLHP